MTSNSLNQSPESATSLDPSVWWVKPLIWAGFLALLYILREFFLIGFLTFLMCFVVRGLVGFLKRHLAPHRDSRSLELVLTLSILVGFCVSLVGLGRYFVPPLIRQGKSLLTHLQNTSPADLQNSVLANTVGTWEFRQQFGTPQDDRYQKAFRDFQNSDRHGEGLYQEFPRLLSHLRSEFEASYEQAQIQHLQHQGSVANEQFAHWLQHLKVPQLLKENRSFYLSQWQAQFAAPSQANELRALKERPDFDAYRDEQLRQRVLASIKSDPAQLAKFQKQWLRERSVHQWDELRNSPGYQAEFKKFYESQRAENPNAAPIDYSFFQLLATAYPQGKDAFQTAAREFYAGENESLTHQQQHDFEAATRLALGQQWWANSHLAAWVRDHAQQDGPRVLEAMVAWVESGLGQLVRFPVQVATSLVLSLFMLIEWQGLKEGVASLRDTRLQPIIEVIEPGVIALGKLIGKTFQGQVVIAFFNACFTLVALWLIGVEYLFVLVSMVFVFSFIPVVGVILSGIPMCAIAVSQPGGSLLMALQVIVAIAIIHMLEATVLSPRIIGKIGHLHPVLVIVILLVAEDLFGMWGLVLGVPVAIYLIRVVILDVGIPGVYEPTRSH